VSTPCRSPREGFNLIELLVVLAIVVVLIGLLLPAVQKVREAANRVKCQNNLRQIVLAFHHADEARGSMPPGIGWYPTPQSKAGGNGLFHVLPFLEQDNLYRQSSQKDSNGQDWNGPWFNKVYSQPVKVFLCPSDPSAPSSGVVKDKTGEDWGASSYAGNALVLCRVSSARDDPPWELLDPQNYSRLGGASFPDGTANTILLAEKYAVCTNHANPEGGNLWAYWITGPAVLPYHPGFGISWNKASVGPQSRFLVRPQPFDGTPNGDCDPTKASTPHQVMQVALADGSVRALSPDLSRETWWALCTPNGGEVLGNDFQ
jgi:prepilin-type N-terminal cleavage/methylation domain-containing protein